MHTLLQGFTLGVVGGLIPGPILTLLLLSVLQAGLAAGLRAFIWAMVSEVVIAGTLLIIAIQLPISDSFFTALGFIGSGVLIFFSYQVFQLRSVTVQNQGVTFTPQKIFIISVTNATLYIFWVTVCFPLIWQLSAAWGIPVAAGTYFLSFELGWGLTTFGMMLLFIFVRPWLSNERIMHTVYIFLSVVLAALSLNMLIRALMMLI